MTTPSPIILPETESGKDFLEKLNNLKEKLNIRETEEKTKKFKNLSQNEIEENIFLTDFLNFMKEDKELVEMYNFLKIKNIFIGNFGRKTSFVYHPIKEPFFRFVLHFGDPEIYYLDSTIHRDKPLALLNGYGFIISPQEAARSSLTVYSDPVRFVYDNKIQEQIPKIRPKKYSRTTIIYDYEYKDNYVEEKLEKVEK